MWKFTNNVAKLFNAIINHKSIKEIEKLASKVLAEQKTLNVINSNSPSKLTVLEVVMLEGSKEIFQLLVRLGADPFFKLEPQSRSVMEKLTEEYFSPSPVRHYDSKELFLWMVEDKDSPLFTWAKLRNDEALFEKFKAANLVTSKRYKHQLPLYLAIQANRLDLVKEVMRAAGNIQKAGHISRMSVLRPAIIASLEGNKDSLEILKYLLEQGASTETSDYNDFPALILTLVAPTLMCGNVKEEKVLEVVQLLLKHHASLEAINPHNNWTLLMTARKRGYKQLFDFFLERATPANLNHQGLVSPDYLVFQLFDEFNIGFHSHDILDLLPVLKEKGADFSKTIFFHPSINYFESSSILNSEHSQVSAEKASLLHFYVENMTRARGADNIEMMDKHLEIIQSLTANGVNPNLKATFTLTKKPYNAPEVQSSVELTASEYARKLADKIIDRFGSNLDSFLVKEYKDEKDFLQHITYREKKEQTRLHKIFHQFRNLERVLSGQKPLPYSGLPDVEKIVKTQQTAVTSTLVSAKNDLNSHNLETQLINARKQQNKDDWQAFKKSITDYVKGAESYDDFLARVEEFKKPLQLHFDISIDPDTKAVSYGSMTYRFFHCFDNNKFPTSWETLRAFGQNKYGTDINTQYDTQLRPF